MRRFLIAGVALILAATFTRADIAFPGRPGPGPGQRQPFPQPQVQKAKVSIEEDAKATEPRLIVPMQTILGGFNFGGGAIGGPPGGAFGQVGGPPGGQMGFPPGALGQAGALGAVGGPPPGQAGAAGVFGFAGGQQGQPPQPPGFKGGNVPPGGFQGVPPGIPGQPPNPPRKPEPPEKEPQAGGKLKTMMIGLALALSLSFGGLWLSRQSGAGPRRFTSLLVFATVMGLGLGFGAAWANRAPPMPPVQPKPQPAVPGKLPVVNSFDGVRVELSQQGDTIRLILPKKMSDQLKPKARE